MEINKVYILKEFEKEEQIVDKNTFFKTTIDVSLKYVKVIVDNSSFCKEIWDNTSNILFIVYEDKKLSEIISFHNKYYPCIEFQLIYNSCKFENYSSLEIKFLYNLNYELSQIIVGFSLTEKNWNYNLNLDSYQNLINAEIIIFDILDELKYAIQYDENGIFYNCYDFKNKENIMLNEIDDVNNNELMKIEIPSSILVQLKEMLNK